VLSFVVPLQAKITSSNWDRTCVLLEGTIRSLLNQSDADGFRIVVACHDAPSIPEDSRLHIVQVGFPPPDPVDSASERIVDKFKKLSTAMEVVGQAGTDFTMRVDADDLVSSKIAAYANANLGANGWQIRSGYYFQPGRRSIRYRATGFDCGTNIILSSRLHSFPELGHVAPDPDCLLSRWGHKDLPVVLARQGIDLPSLPFPGAVYVIHGDSLAAFSRHRPRHTPTLRYRLGWLRRTRPLTRHLRLEFGFG
jgi:hypothetical protein